MGSIVDIRIRNSKKVEKDFKSRIQKVSFPDLEEILFDENLEQMMMDRSVFQHCYSLAHIDCKEIIVAFPFCTHACTHTHLYILKLTQVYKHLTFITERSGLRSERQPFSNTALGQCGALSGLRISLPSQNRATSR